MSGFLSQWISKGFLSLRQFERDLGRVIDVLKPGPLGILEQKFSNEEIAKAYNEAEQAVLKWKLHVNKGQQ
ncbi:hypothetical protein KP509_20G089400 [Ceratopteris richardii]|uniref:Uncharacterized protein n=1 Tax=Ceratopteris richardii TaxID=49495 RepID=A0A8T2SH49_CERRI|nr:hypothetical protein KP509_20G089400 [Ceratopteris richardii]KAH7332476.1 hypothetical protein KP509_20G089400 [Ceratopteris richardii]